MIELKGKNILLFAPDFFGYDKEIKGKLELLGACVDMYNERPSSNFFIKAIIRVYKKAITIFVDRYFNKIIKQNLHKKYDYVLIIKGEVFNQSIITRLKKAFPEAKYILYLWDSIQNYKDIQECLPMFDKKMSFDKNDTKYNPALQFRPLFYIDDYKTCVIDSYEFDLLFVGTVHSDRWLFLKKIREQALIENKRVYYYLYIQSPIIFMFRKIFDKRLRSIPFSEIRFKSISKKEIILLTSKAKIILDIQHPKQTGLTMRTFETMGANRKLMTTNSSISDYDFFNTNNILIIDRIHPVIENTFWESSYNQIPEALYSKYSIDGWINDIFS